MTRQILVAVSLTAMFFVNGVAQAQPADYYVNKSQDDAEEGTNGQLDLTNEDLDLGQLSGFESAKAIGLRFEGIRLKKNPNDSGSFPTIHHRRKSNESETDRTDDSGGDVPKC